MITRSNVHQNHLSSRKPPTTQKKTKTPVTTKKTMVAKSQGKPQAKTKPTAQEKEEKLIANITEKEKELKFLKTQLSKVQKAKEEKNIDQLATCAILETIAIQDEPPEEPKEEPTLKIDVLGSSIARPIKENNIRCSGRKVTANVSSHPGATIERLNRKLAERSMFMDKDVILHVGTNNLCKDDDSRIISEYRALISNAKLRYRNVFVSSILPRRDSLAYRVDKLNGLLETECGKLGVIFIENDYFFRDNDGFRINSLFRDSWNIHPSDDLGTRILEDSFSSALSGYYNSDF